MKLLINRNVGLLQSNEFRRAGFDCRADRNRRCYDE